MRRRNTRRRSLSDRSSPSQRPATFYLRRLKQICSGQRRTRAAVVLSCGGSTSITGLHSLPPPLFATTYQICRRRRHFAMFLVRRIRSQFAEKLFGLASGALQDLQDLI
nr:hypothetical protein Iba_scaffold4978CG1300 [Ipomoea batatas]